MSSSNPDGLLTMSGLVRNGRLRAYLSNVRDWHGYIRFLGLPDRRDNPDIVIDQLFVEPLLTRRYVSPDENPSKWLEATETILDVLKHHRYVVLLGDPGTGKSTVLNYLVWRLARPTSEAWAKRMGSWRLPIPMLLRELKLQGVRDFDGLLHAFLGHAMSEPLRRGKYLREMLDRGKAFILLDGIDEVSDIEARRALRSAVLDGIVRYPDCQWLLSSRIVGYSEVPFDVDPKAITLRVQTAPIGGPVRQAQRAEEDRRRLFDQPSLLGDVESAKIGEDAVIVTRYVAPFDDGRIEEFAQNWYAQREAAAGRAGSEASHLVHAVHADDAILRLARIPNLLTMMALIHRIEATLPHGRALLYERIAEAYLESIDRFRGVYSGAFNLPQKKRWLGRVGYEMQVRRSTGHEEGTGEVQAELLAETEEVVRWLEEEMEQSRDTGGMTAREFLDFVGRRSGLFLPRGEGRYAFVHLSFQEYFAAIALEREVTGLQWARGGKTQLGVTRDGVAEWAGRSAWREPFVFLFELLAVKEDWHAEVMDVVFGEGFAGLEDRRASSDVNLAELLARLVVNSRSGLGGRPGEAAVAAVRPALRRGRVRKYPPSAPGVFVTLFGDDAGWNRKILTAIVEQAEALGIRELTLEETQVSDIEPLSALGDLEDLSLRQTPVLDIGPVGGLGALRLLDVSGTRIRDLRPLERLSELVFLNVGGYKSCGL